MYQSENEQSKRVFYYHESNNNKNNNIESNDSVTRNVCQVYCLKMRRYNKPRILDRLVITGKYQTSVFLFSRKDRTLR